MSKISDGTARRECAVRLERLILATIDGTVPWSFAPLEWDVSFLSQLLNPPHDAVPKLLESLAADYVEMGDLLIINEFRRLTMSLDNRVIDVDVWTLDGTLRAVIDAVRA